MALSQSRKNSIKRYLEKFEEIRVRLPKGERTIIAEHAIKTGESVNGFVRRAIYETMERDTKSGRIQLETSDSE